MVLKKKKRGWGSQISKQSAHEGGRVVSPTHLFPHEIFLVLISVRGWVDPRARVRLKRLCQWKIPVTPFFLYHSLPFWPFLTFVTFLLYEWLTWDRLFYFPFRRKACCKFSQPEKSDGFGRERTRDLGYQRPARKPLDHRSRFGNRSRDFPVCSAVLQLLGHRVPQYLNITGTKIDISSNGDYLLKFDIDIKQSHGTSGMTCTWIFDNQLHRRISVLELRFVCTKSVFMRNIFHSKSTIHDSKLNRLRSISYALQTFPSFAIYIHHYIYFFGWGNVLQSGRSRVRFPIESLKFLLT
jgi:hypothetical protein